MKSPSGMSFPFKFAPTGGVARSEGAEKVRDNLRFLVLTARGERLVRKTVGTVGYRRIFRNMAGSDVTLIEGLVRKALAEQEPRFVVQSITTITDNPNKTQSIRIAGFLRISGEPLAVDIQL